MKRCTREAFAEVRRVLEPLGCEVTFARETNHAVLHVVAPTGGTANIALAGTPRDGKHQRNKVRQEAMRHARAWGLI